MRFKNSQSDFSIFVFANRCWTAHASSDASRFSIVSGSPRCFDDANTADIDDNEGRRSL